MPSSRRSARRSAGGRRNHQQGECRRPGPGLTASRPRRAAGRSCRSGQRRRGRARRARPRCRRPAATASSSSQRAATPSVRSASSASVSLACRISARRFGVSGRRSSPTSSRVHHGRSTSGRPLVNTTRRSWLSASRWTMLFISLRSGGERHLADARRSRARRPAGRPCAPPPAGRPRSDRPARPQRPSRCSTTALFGAVSDRERAVELGPERADDCLHRLPGAPLRTRRTQSRRTRPARLR